MSLPDVN